MAIKKICALLIFSSLVCFHSYGEWDGIEFKITKGVDMMSTNSYELHRLWSGDTGEIKLGDYLNQSHSCAVTDDFLLIPKVGGISHENCDAMVYYKYDRWTGDFISEETVHFTDSQLQELKSAWMTNRFYLINDDLGNVAILPECYVEGYNVANEPYTVFIGVLNVEDNTVDNMMKVNLKHFIKDSSSKCTWGYLGMPDVIGDIPTNDFELLLPLSYKRDGQSRMCMASVTAQDFEIGEYSITMSLLDNNWSELKCEERPFSHWVNDFSFFVDTKGWLPSYHERTKHIQSVNENRLGVYDRLNGVKGLNVFGYDGQRFLISGDYSLKGSPQFTIYAWNGQLPQAEGWDDEQDYFENLEPLVTIDDGYIELEKKASSQSISAKATTDLPSDFVISTSGNELWGGSQDIHLYVPGRYMTTFRLVAKNRTSEVVGNINVGDEDELYYTLDGVRLTGRPERPGIYLHRKGVKTEKVVIK